MEQGQTRPQRMIEATHLRFRCTFRRGDVFSPTVGVAIEVSSAAEGNGNSFCVAPGQQFIEMNVAAKRAGLIDQLPAGGEFEDGHGASLAMGIAGADVDLGNSVTAEIVLECAGKAIAIRT